MPRGRVTRIYVFKLEHTVTAFTTRAHWQASSRRAHTLSSNTVHFNDNHIRHSQCPHTDITSCKLSVTANRGTAINRIYCCPLTRIREAEKCSTKCHYYSTSTAVELSILFLLLSMFLGPAPRWLPFVQRPPVRPRFRSRALSCDPIPCAHFR